MISNKKQASIIYLAILICAYFSFNFSFIKKEAIKSNKAILIRAILNNSEYILMKDSINNIDSCLKIIVDTIDINKIKKIRKNKLMFKYNNQEYYYSQLLSFDKFNKYREYYIKSFTLSCSCIGELMVLKNDGACFKDETKEKIKFYNEKITNNKFLNRGRLLFENILLKVSKDEELRLNSIVLDVCK